jgi:hypothetical protein
LWRNPGAVSPRREPPRFSREQRSIWATDSELGFTLVEAGQLAQSLLARLGTDMPIAPGQATGEFAGGYRWRRGR